MELNPCPPNSDSTPTVSIFFWIEASSRVPRKILFWSSWHALASGPENQHWTHQFQKPRCSLCLHGRDNYVGKHRNRFVLVGELGLSHVWEKYCGRIFCELSLSLYKQLKDQNWSRIERQRVWYGPHVWISDVWWCLDRMNNYTFWNATILPCFQRSQRSANHIRKKTRTWSFTCSHGSCWNNTWTPACLWQGNAASALCMWKYEATILTPTSAIEHVTCCAVRLPGKVSKIQTEEGIWILEEYVM